MPRASWLLSPISAANISKKLELDVVITLSQLMLDIEVKCSMNLDKLNSTYLRMLGFVNLTPYSTAAVYHTVAVYHSLQCIMICLNFP